MATASSPASLYNRIGGYDTIAAVVEEYLDKLMADPRWRVSRRHEAPTRGSAHGSCQIAYLSEKAGGPSFYLGKDMKTAHVGVSISARDWELARGPLNDALAKCRAPEKESREFAGLFEALRSRIVER